MKFITFLANFLLFACLYEKLQAARLFGKANSLPFSPLQRVPFDQPIGRIVNGQNANPDQFPYQILLRSTAGVVCGGSIVSKNYVLTAAHCIDESIPPSNYFVFAGTITFDSSNTIIPLAEYRRHPNFADFVNDIASLRLSTPLSFSSSIQPIPLETGAVPSGAAVIISGWGGIYTGGPIATTLQWTTLFAINNGVCAQRIGRAPPQWLCLEHSNGNGACLGDSGGPAAYNGKLAGVASFVAGSCASSLPDGYVKVSEFLDWIHQNTDV